MPNPQRKSLLRRLLVVGGFLLILAAGVGGYLYYRIQGVPSWYLTLEDPEVIDESSRRLEDKLQDARNWAASVAAAEIRARRGTLNTSKVPIPPDAMTLRLSGQEITAFFLKWSALQGWDEVARAYFDDPVVAVFDGHLVIAGRVREVGTVVSLMYKPQLDAMGSKLVLKLDRVMGGRLALPVEAIGAQLERLRGPLTSAQGRWIRDARLDSNGQANSALSLALASRIARAMIDGSSTDAVAVIPVDNRSLLVRIVGLELVSSGGAVDEKGGVVAGGELVLQLRPLEPEQRKAVLESLK